MLGSHATDRQLLLLNFFTGNSLNTDEHKNLEENNLLYPCQYCSQKKLISPKTGRKAEEKSRRKSLLKWFWPSKLLSIQN